MKVPLWIAAVVPAALVAHGWAYAVCACDPHTDAHGWIAPAMEISLGLLIACAAALIGGTLLRINLVHAGRIERSPLQLFVRLFLAQSFIYSAAEFAEGTHATLLGIALQLIVALAAAFAIAVFCNLLVRAAARFERAARYCRRTATTRSMRYVAPLRPRPHLALAVAIGDSRFQRPPPIG